MYKLLFLFLFSVLISCQLVKKDFPITEFQKKTNQFFEKIWSLDPLEASQVGNHKYSEKSSVKDTNYYEAYARLLSQSRSDFLKIERSKLSQDEIVDLDLLLNYIESSLWHIKTFKSHEWRPDYYNYGSHISTTLEASNLNENEKLKSLKSRLQKIDEYYLNAKKNIFKPTKEHTELAISQNKSLVLYIDSLKIKFKDEELLVSLDKAKDIVKSYVNFLVEVKNNPQKVGGFRSFRIGKKLYEQKFKFDINSDRTPLELYSIALKNKSEAINKMYEISQNLWEKYFSNEKKPKQKTDLIKKIISKVSLAHGKPEEFVEDVKKQVPHLVAYVNKKNLIYLDPSKPLKIRETPVYERGFAGASVDAPGFFDAGRETFYNVTPLGDMSPDEQESYLREYNKFTMQILNIHEAIPGHYTQLIYSNKNPSLVKKILGNGSMVEGWAVYSERMMIESGYAEGIPELELMYYKWFLRAVCNTIIDYSIHNLNWSKEKTVNFLIQEAFQEKAEADKKWKRATYSQVQLATYFAGFVDIYELRDKYKLKLGPEYNIKKFNEHFLSYGSASVKSIKSLMNLN